MDPILDSVLTEIIAWRLQYLEDTGTDDQEFERLKSEYLKLSLSIFKGEGREFSSEVELADCLYGIFETAKSRTKNESKHLHIELDSVLSRGKEEDLP